MPTYVAGYDGSVASRTAVHFAAQLGRVLGGDVIAAHVFAPLRVGHIYAVIVSMSEEDEKRSKAEHVLERLDEEGVDRRVVAASSPAYGLQSLAEKVGAALLVVGTTHHGALGRLVPGGEAEKLLHGSPCPVAVVPADARLDDLDTVAVAYDGGEEAEGALVTAESLARRFGARLLLVSAVDPAPYTSLPAVRKAEAVRSAREQAEHLLTQAGRKMTGDLRVESRIVAGPPRRALVQACADDADVLVMGSRGYGPLRSVLLGSVSRRVVDDAPCPVIIVPRGARTDLGSVPETVAAAPSPT